MLILIRRISERIIIDDHNNNIIAVQILSVRGNQARLGIDAPPGIAVHREEIYDRIKKEEEHNENS